MITKVTARTRSAYNNAINKELSLSPLGVGELCLRPIDGLGPVKATVNTTDFPTEAGGIYLSSKTGQRNIVLTVEFKPEWTLGSTVGALREKLDEVFMPTNKVELDFLKTDGKTYRIEGTVESNEPSVFTKDPVSQISILCPEPYFTSSDGLETVNFPINGPELLKVPFDGKVDTGFIFEFEMLEPRPNGLTIFKLPKQPTNYLKITHPLISADVVRFSTVKGERYATHTRAGTTKSLLGWFSGSLVDTRLVNGDNYFEFPDIDYTKNVKVMYTKVYGGIL